MRRPIRVMSVIDELRIGGAERLLLDALRCVPHEDVEPSLILLHEHPQEALLLDELPGDIEVIRLRRPKTKGLDLLPQLVRHVRRVRPHIVHTHLFRSNLWGGIAARMGGAVHLCTEHGPLLSAGTPLANDEMQNRARHVFARNVLVALGSRFLAVSEFVADGVSAVAGVPRERFSVVYNGVDLQKFTSGSGARARRDLSIPEDAVVLGTCGRLVEWKGGARFASAARLVLEQDPAARVLIVGDGPERPAIEHELRPVARRVHMVGYQNKVADYVAAMDVFVAASRLDPVGIVLYEAMLLGRACVVVKSGSAADPWFRDAPVRFASATANSQELAGAIMQLARDAEAREQLGAAAARDARERFDIRRMVREYVAVYRSLAVTR